jgi:hypothetical protein
MKLGSLACALVMICGCSDCGKGPIEQLPPTVSTPPPAGKENPPEVEDPVFGQAWWGMDVDAARLVLPGARDTLEGVLVIDEHEYHGAPTKVLLDFNEKGKLVEITASVIYDGIAQGDHERVYEDLRAGLVTQFGEPHKETMFDLSDGPPGGYEAFRSAFFKTEGTLADLVCRGESCTKAMSVLLRSRHYRKKFE